MEYNTLNNKVFIVENNEGEYTDIVECLPNTVVPEEFMPRYDATVIEALSSDHYCLCICDIIEFKDKVSGLSEDHPTVFEEFKNGIMRIAELCNHFDCPFIIVTKFPVRRLRDCFDRLKDDPDNCMEAIFTDDYSTLRRKLNSKKHYLDGVVYEDERAHIVIKPYSAGSWPNDDILAWKKELACLLSKLCLTEKMQNKHEMKSVHIS